MKIIIPEAKDIPFCAETYISAYNTEPWNEDYKKAEVEKYISDYLDSKTKFCFAAAENEKIIGIVLCTVVPGIGAPFIRIEDFCIAGGEQGKGFGSEFMEIIAKSKKTRLRFNYSGNTKRLSIP